MHCIGAFTHVQARFGVPAKPEYRSIGFARACLNFKMVTTPVHLSTVITVELLSLSGHTHSNLAATVCTEESSECTELQRPDIWPS